MMAFNPARRPGSRLALLTATLLAAGAMTGCSASRADDPDGGQENLEVAADDYTYDAPDQVTAGPRRLSLHNSGAEPHHAQLFRLADDATTDELLTVLESGDPAELTALGTFAGGTGVVDPASTSRADAVVDLSAGRYALVCFLPTADGVPHYSEGMVRELRVTAATASAEPAPPADAEVALVDYGFEVPQRVAGDAVLEVHNRSRREPHEMVISRLDDGTTAGDVLDAFEAGRPPPSTAVGGMQALPPGVGQRLQLDLEPGRYLLLCRVPSPDGTEHAHKGMVTEITVE